MLTLLTMFHLLFLYRILQFSHILGLRETEQVVLRVPIPTPRPPPGNTFPSVSMLWSGDMCAKIHEPTLTRHELTCAVSMERGPSV